VDETPALNLLRERGIRVIKLEHFLFNTIYFDDASLFLHAQKNPPLIRAGILFCGKGGDVSLRRLFTRESQLFLILRYFQRK
jgi:hypothetical protein